MTSKKKSAEEIPEHLKPFLEPRELVGLTIAEVLCFWNMRYPLIDLQNFLGSRKFTEMIIQFSGTYHKIPEWHHVCRAMCDLVAADCILTIKKSREHNDYEGWSKAEETLENLAAFMKTTYHQVLKGGKEFLKKEANRIKTWLQSLEAWDRDNVPKTKERYRIIENPFAAAVRVSARRKLKGINREKFYKVLEEETKPDGKPKT